jgi:hypothetical protein
VNKSFIKYCMIAVTITYTALFLDMSYGSNKDIFKKISKEQGSRITVSSSDVISGERQSEVVADGAYFTPCINNDGTRLLYSSGDNIYEMELKTKEVVQLTTIGNCYNPVYYEKDNNIIAFARNDGIYRMDLKNKKIAKVVSSNEPEVSFAKPNFTPEGDIIYFRVTVLPRPEGHGFMEKDPSIIKTSQNGAIQEKIIEGYNPVLSTDGKKLLYELNNNIYLLDMDTKDSRLIDAGKYAAWSNSGKYISYAKFDRSTFPYTKLKGKRNLFIDKEYSNIYIAEINDIKNKKKLTQEEFDDKSSDIDNWAKAVEDSTAEQHFLVVSKIAYFDSTWNKDDKDIFVSIYNSDMEAFKLVKYNVHE